MINFVCKDKYDINDFIKLIEFLRSENGCPWDKIQTHESIRRNFVEEAYEVVEAIDENSTEHLKEELGDVLMQVIFHADIERAAGRFDINDVADGVCKKLIYRHPNLFSEDGEYVDWEELKRREKHMELFSDDLLRVAKSLPALWRSEKVIKKAEKSAVISGDLDDAKMALNTAAQQFCESGSDEDLAKVLFCAAYASAEIKCDPEKILSDRTDRFIKDFMAVESGADTFVNIGDTLK